MRRQWARRCVAAALGVMMAVPMQLFGAVTAFAADELEVHYREAGVPSTVTSGDANYVLWFTKPEDGIDGYELKLKGPGSENPDGVPVAAPADASGNYAVASGDEIKELFTKPGEYTLEAKKGNVTKSGKIDILKVTFDSGDGGEFVGEGNTHDSYYERPKGVYSSYLLHHGVIPEITPSGSPLIGWASETGVTDPADEKMLDKAGYDVYTNLISNDSMQENSGTYTVHAAYGVRETKGLAVTEGNTPGGGEYKNEKIVLGTDAVSGYSGSAYEKKFCLKNTGTGEIHILPQHASDGLVVKYLASGGGDAPKEENGQIKIAGGDYVVLSIMPADGFGSGTHTGAVRFRYEEGSMMYLFQTEFTVKGNELEVFLPETTKVFGETKDLSGIVADKIVYKGTQNAYEGTLASLGVTVSSEGAAEGARVGSYPYTLSGATGGFTVTVAATSGKVTVEQAEPQKSSMEASSVHAGQTVADSKLKGTFSDPNRPGTPVTGKLVWDNPSESVGNSEGTHEAAWTFTPTDTRDYKTVHGTQSISVSSRKPTTITREGGNTFEYDGETHAMTFTHDRAAGSAVISVKYQKQGAGGWVAEAPKDAGVYNVQATIAEEGQYAAAELDDTLTITKKELTIDSVKIRNKTYNGQADLNAEVTEVTFSGFAKGDSESDVKADMSGVTASFLTANVSDRAEASVTVARLTGTKAGNYSVPQGAFHSYGKILPAELTVKLNGTKEKFYGQEITLLANEFTANVKSGDTPKLSFVCDGLNAEAEVKAEGYPITVTNLDPNYKLTSTSCGTVTIKATVIAAEDGIVTAGAGWKNGKLSGVSISGTFRNPYNAGMIVPGELKWTDEGKTLGNGSTDSASWTFTPKGSNYDTTPVTGEAEITLADKQPVLITADSNQGKVYDGSEYTVNYDVDPKGTPVTVQYRKLPGGEYSSHAPQNAGQYEALLTSEGTVDRGPNALTVTIEITPAETHSDIPSEMQVAKGTLLSEIDIRGYKFTGVGGDVEGLFSWDDPDTAVTEDGQTFAWEFVPNDGNHKSVSGTVRFTLKAEEPDNREVQAAAYNTVGNIPGYVRFSMSGLKDGDRIAAFWDAECMNLATGEITVTGADITAGSIAAGITSGTMSEDGGDLYVKIVSAEAGKAVSVHYNAVPKVSVKADTAEIRDGIRFTPGRIVNVSIGIDGLTWKVDSFEITGGDDLISVMGHGDSGTYDVEGLTPGNGELVFYLSAKHPDPEMKTEVLFTVSVPVYVEGRFEVEADPGTVLPSLSIADSEALGSDPGIYDEDAKTALQNGGTVDVVLSAKEAGQELASDVKKAETAAAAGGWKGADALDITLTRYIDGGSAKDVHTVGTAVPVVVGIPEDTLSEANGAEFAVVRVHDGNAEILPDTDEDPATITFLTDRFSLYLIAYKTSEIVQPGPEEPELDFTELDKLITDASGLDASGYEDFSAVEKALTAAKSVKENANATQSDIDAAADALRTAIEGLKEKPQETPGKADTRALERLLGAAKSLVPEDYWDFSDVTAAISEAETLLGKTLTDADQTAVDAAARKLQTAMDALTRKGKADVTELKALADEARKLDPNAYMDFSAVEKALAAADALLAKDLTDRDQAAVDAATDALRKAIAELVEKPVSTPGQADTRALERLVAEAGDLNPAHYKDFAGVRDALDAARALLAKDLTDKDQAAVDVAAKTLKDAIEALERVEQGTEPAPGKADTRVLEGLVAKAKGLNASDYEDFSGVTEALKEAEELLKKDLTDADQAAVDQAARKLETALARLKYGSADYLSVEAAKRAAAGIDRSLYTDASLKRLDDAVAAVVYGLDKSRQSDVDAMAAAIRSAIRGLVEKGADLSGLRDAYEDALRLNPNYYANFGRVRSAMARARQMLDNPSRYTEAQIKAAEDELRDAMAALTPRSDYYGDDWYGAYPGSGTSPYPGSMTGGSTGSTSTGGGSTGSGTTQPDASGNVGKDIQTGVAERYGMYLGIGMMLLLCAGGCVVWYKRKKR